MNRSARLSERIAAMVKEKYREQAELQVAQLMASASSPSDLFGTQGCTIVATAFDRMLAGVKDEASEEEQITYISVLERTKEICILCSAGSEQARYLACFQH